MKAELSAAHPEARILGPSSRNERSSESSEGVGATRKQSPSSSLFADTLVYPQSWWTIADALRIHLIRPSLSVLSVFLYWSQPSRTDPTYYRCCCYFFYYFDYHHHDDNDGLLPAMRSKTSSTPGPQRYVQ